MKGKFIYFFSFIMLFFCTSLSGQKLNFVNYSIEQGLVQSQALHIEQDSYGYLWVSTLGGISRFDGNEFVNYTRRSGLSSQIVYSSLHQKGKGLWLATQKGLQLYDGNTFTNYPLADSREELMIIQLMLSGDTEVWALGAEGKLYKTEGERLRIHEPHANQMFHDLAMDRNANPYAVSPDFIYNLSTNTRIDVAPLTSRGISLKSLSFDHYNRALLATSNGVFRKEGERYEELLNGDEIQAYVTSLIEDHKGNIWAGTTRGAYRIDTVGTITHIGRNSGLTDNTITGIMEDREHNLWFATDAHGIFRLSANPVQWYDSTHGLNGTVVMSMARDGQGRIWIGTSDGGLSLFQEGNFRTIELPSSRVEAKRINTLFNDSSDNLWVGTLGSGLWRRSNNLFSRVFTSGGEQLHEVFAMGQDVEGTIWVTSSTGLYYYEDGVLRAVNGIQGPGFAVYGHQADTLLVGTTSGLYRVIGKSRVSRIKLENRELHTVNTITKYGRFLALGTEDDGILFWDQSTGDILQCSSANGLPSDFIYSLYPESDTSLLAGTGKGVCRISFDQKAGQFQVSNFLASGNRYGPECNLNAVLPVEGGSEIWFGTTNGIFGYPLGSWKDVDEPPLIYLRSVEILPAGDSERLNKRNWNSRNWEPASLNLSHDRNHLTFDFKGVYLSNPEGLKYQYQLVGVDTGFSKPVSTNRIIYPNLNPGEYRFKVIAITDNQLVSSNEIDFPFVIESPLYQKSWFRVLLIVLLLLVGVSIEFLRSHLKQRRSSINRKIRLEEQNRILEHTSEDLHDDLGNKITRITVLTDVLQRKIGTEDGERLKLVRQIRENAESLYLSTREILWALTPGQDTLMDIMEKCRNLGVQMFADADIDFTTRGIQSTMNDIPVPLSIARNLSMIIKEAFTNILKHSHANKVEMEAGLSQDGTLLVNILDNGRGCKPDPCLNGNGMNNMQKRTERIGGSISFSNGESGGLRVSLRVKIPPKEG